MPTFAEAAERWLAAESARPATRRRCGSTALRSSTCCRSSASATCPRSRSTTLADYLARKRAEGLKPWTVKSHLTAFRRTFGYAQRRLGFRGQAPATLSGALGDPGDRRGAEAGADPGRDRRPDPGRAESVLRAVRAAGHVRRAGSARRSGCAGAGSTSKRARIDFEAGTVEIAEQLVRGADHRGRLGPPAARRPLQDARGAQGGPRSGGW